jgi:DNA-binding transcriptional MerR regulator
MSSESVIPADRDDFKIGEVCDIASVKPFVLRYWETEFPELSPAKSSGGQRTYSRADVELILRIKHLLYEERFTVAGAKKRLSDEAEQRQAPKPAKKPKLDSTGQDQVERLRRVLRETRVELEAIATKLR